MEGDKSFDAKARRSAANQPRHGVLPFSLPRAGVRQAPAKQKPFLPSLPCPAETLVGSHPRCRQEPTGRKGLRSRAGESQGGWGEPTVLREPAGMKEMSPRAGQPCWGKAAMRWARRVAGGCGAGESHRLLQGCFGAPQGATRGAPSLPAHVPGVQAATPGAAGCCLPALRTGKRPFNGRECIYLFLLLHNQGLNISKGRNQLREKGTL